MILLNLIFIAFSIPVVTLPAALCGMNRVWVNLVRDGNCFLWLDFIGEFKSSFKKSLPLGLLFGGGLFVSWYILSLSVTNGDTVFGVFFGAIGIFAALFTTLMGGWTFALVAMLPLKNRDLLKNARILALLSVWRSIGVVAAVVLLGVFTFFLFPYALVPVVFLLVSLVQYTICFLVYEPVMERIVRPYETAAGSGGKP
jgi:hypothetical protein